MATARPGAINPETIARSVKRSAVLQSRISDPSRMVIARPVRAGARSARTGTIGAASVDALVTETVIVEGARPADLAAAKTMGASIIEEGFDGKVLLKVDSIDRAFALLDMLQKRQVGAVTPNFLRRVMRPVRSAPTKAWVHVKIGVPAETLVLLAGRRRHHRRSAFVRGAAGVASIAGLILASVLNMALSRRRVRRRDGTSSG